MLYTVNLDCVGFSQIQSQVLDGIKKQIPQFD